MSFRIKKINVLIFFFLILNTGIVFAIWKSLQSERFGEFVSAQISNFLANRIDSNVRLEKIDFVFFPPSIVLNNVEFNKKLPGEITEIQLFSKKIQLVFDLIDVFASQISFRRIVIENGELVFVTKESLHQKIFNGPFSGNKSEKNQPVSLHFLELGSIEHHLNKMPITVDAVLLKDMHFYANEQTLGEANIHIKRSKSKITFWTLWELSNVNHTILKPFPVDSIALQLVIAKDALVLESLMVRSGLSSLRLENIVAKDLKDLLKNDFQSDFFVQIDAASEINPMLKTKVFSSGVFEITGKGKIQRDKLPTADLKLTAQNLTNIYFPAKNLELQAVLDSNHIKLNSLSIKNEDQEVTLRNNVQFIFQEHFQRGFMFPLRLKGLNSSYFLYHLKDDLDPLDTTVTGDFNLSINKYEMGVNCISECKIEKLVLHTFDKSAKNSKPSIFSFLSPMELQKFKLKLGIDKSNDDLFIEMAAKNTIHEFEGELSTKNGLLESAVQFHKINLSDLQKISGISVKGEGKLDFSYRKTALPAKDDQLNFKININSSQLAEFKFGNLQGDFILNPQKGLISLGELKGLVGKSNYRLDGSIRLSDGDDSNINLQVLRGRYEDVFELFSAYAEKSDAVPRGTSGDFDLDVELTGPLDPAKFQIVGKASGKELNVYDESFDVFAIDIDYQNQFLLLSNMNARLNQGTARGVFSADLRLKTHELNLEFKEIPLKRLQQYRKLQLGIDGVLDGTWDWSEKGSSYKNKEKISLKLSQSTLDKLKLPDSNFLFHKQFDTNLYQLQLFRDEVDLTFKTSAENKNIINAKLNIPNLERFISSFFVHNLTDRTFRGSLVAQADFVYTDKDFLDLSGAFKWDKLEFFRGVDGFLLPPGKIILRSGEIVPFRFKSDGANFDFIVTGSGVLGKTALASLNANFPTSILQILTPSMSDTSGRLSLEVDAVYSKSLPSFKSALKIQDVGFNYKGVPGSFNGLKGEILHVGKNISAEKIHGKFAGGDFRLLGNAKVIGAFPELHIKAEFANSTLEIFKKTKLVSNGKMTLLGNKPPYPLKGDIIINQGQIKDELSDFSSKYRKVTGYHQFLPPQRGERFQSLMDLDLSVRTANDVEFLNSLGTLSLSGSLDIKGTTDYPEIFGNLQNRPGKGRFYFKNSDFSVERGELFFNGNPSLPHLNFLARNKIKIYDLALLITGKPSQLDIKLTSTPYLSQEEIFRLMATGFTEDDERNLSEADRQSVNSVGIGALVMDQLKLGRDLKSSLGVDLSLSPEIVQGSASLLNEGKGNATNKSQTATKIKAQRQLGKKVSVSVSSRIGAEEEQKQELNLNYEFNKNVSVQGVYDIKESAQDERLDNENSVGADLKFRWNFR